MVPFAFVFQDVVTPAPFLRPRTFEIAVVVDLESIDNGAVHACRTQHVAWSVLYPRLSLFVMCLVRDAHCAFALLWSIIPIGAELSV